MVGDWAFGEVGEILDQRGLELRSHDSYLGSAESQVQNLGELQITPPPPPIVQIADVVREELETT